MTIVLDNWASYLTAGLSVLAIIWSIGLVIMSIMRTKGGIKLKGEKGEITIGDDAEETVERRAYDCQQRETVRALATMLGPMSEALIALLQATKGQVNGNIDAALNTMSTARKEYQDFLISQMPG